MIDSDNFDFVYCALEIVFSVFIILKCSTEITLELYETTEIGLNIVVAEQSASG